MTANIQLLRSSNSKERPSPNMLLDGQVFLNVDGTEPGLYFRTTNTRDIVKVGPITVGPDAPNSGKEGTNDRSKGEVWLDTSEKWEDGSVLKVFTGAEWKVIGGFTPENNGAGVETGNLIFNNKFIVKSLEIEGSNSDNGPLQLPRSNKPEGTGQIRYNASNNRFEGRIEDGGNTKWVNLHPVPNEDISGQNLNISQRSTLSGNITALGSTSNTVTGGAVSLAGGNITLGSTSGSTVTFPGGFEVGPQKEIRLQIGTSPKITGFKAPNDLTGSDTEIIYTLPASKGGDQTVLATRNNGQLYWRTVDTLSALTADSLTVTNGLTVGGNTILGDECRDTLTVNSTSTFTCNVTFSDSANDVIFDSSALFKNEVALFAKASDDPAELRFYQNTSGTKGDRQEHIGFKAPIIPANTTLLWTLPSKDASTEDMVEYDISALTSDRGGTLEWKKVNPADLKLNSLAVGTEISSGTVKFNSPVTVDGAVTFNANVGINSGSFRASGNSTFNGDIFVTGSNGIRFQPIGSSSSINLKSPSTVGTEVNLTLPGDEGNSGQVLTTNGNGVLRWSNKTEVNQTPTFDSLTVTGTSNLGGLVTASGGITVSGSTTFSSNLNATAGISSGGDVGIQSGMGLKLYDNDGSSNYIQIKAPSIPSSNTYTWILPDTVGSSDQYLTPSTNSSDSTLIWKNIPNPDIQAIPWKIYDGNAGEDYNHIIPIQTDVYNIGKPDKRIKKLYVRDIHADTVTTNAVNLPTPQPNLLDNGNFDIWQRGRYNSDGTRKTGSPTYRLKGSTPSRIFGPDRWFVSNGAGSFGNTDASGLTITREEHRAGEAPIAGSATYYMKVNIGTLTGATGSNRAYIGQRLEDVRRTAGKQLTLSFWAKSDSATSPNITTLTDFSLHQHDGTQEVAKRSKTKPISLTQGWQRHTVTFEELLPISQNPSNNSYLELRIILPNGNGGKSNIHLDAVKLEESSINTDFVPKSIQEEEINCKRFFQEHLFYDTSDATSGDTHEIRFNPTLRTDNFYQTYFTPLSDDRTTTWGGGTRSGGTYVFNRGRIVPGSSSKRGFVLLVDALNTGNVATGANISHVECDAEL